MATLARHVPAIAAGETRGAIAKAHRASIGSRWAAEVAFALGLLAACVAVLALRMAFVPLGLMPRDLAFTGAGVATLAAIAGFAGSVRLRKRDAIDA